MPSVSRYRTWLAVPADEIEDLKKAHPLMEVTVSFKPSFASLPCFRY